MIRPYIFDFDGTIVNSEPIIREVYQIVTKKLAPHRLDVAKNILIGPTLSETVKEILEDEGSHIYDEFIYNFIKIHDSQVINFTELYPNTHETLSNLHKMKVKMAIATNKRMYPTLKIINYYGWHKFFDFIECSDGEKLPRNKQNLIRTIIKNDISFKNSYYVGDTVNDAISANINNLKFIKVNYGYGDSQDWSGIKIEKKINDIKELLKFQ